VIEADRPKALVSQSHRIKPRRLVGRLDAERGRLGPIHLAVLSPSR